MENIGVVLMMVDVTELPMVRMPRKLNTRVTPGTNKPTATKIRLSMTKISASARSKKCAANRNTVLPAMVIQAPHGARSHVIAALRQETSDGKAN